MTDVAFARDGMTLATPAGLTFFTAGGRESLYAFQGLANNHVYALAAERGSGRVMAGTLAWGFCVGRRRGAGEFDAEEFRA